MKDRKITIISLIITILSFCATIFFGLRAEGFLQFKQDEVVELTPEELTPEELTPEELTPEELTSKESVSKANMFPAILSLISFIIGVISSVYYVISRIKVLKVKKDGRLQYIDKEYKKHKLLISAHYNNKQNVALTVENKNKDSIYDLMIIVAINHLNKEEGKQPPIIGGHLEKLPYIQYPNVREGSISPDRRCTFWIDLNQYTYLVDVLVVWYDSDYIKRSFCITLT